MICNGLSILYLRISATVICCLCSGGDAGSCLEAGCPEYGIFHPSGVAERHGLIAVCHLLTLVLFSSSSFFKNIIQFSRFPI